MCIRDSCKVGKGLGQAPCQLRGNPYLRIEMPRFHYSCPAAGQLQPFVVFYFSRDQPLNAKLRQMKQVIAPRTAAQSYRVHHGVPRGDSHCRPQAPHHVGGEIFRRHLPGKGPRAAKTFLLPNVAQPKLRRKDVVDAPRRPVHIGMHT